MVSNYTIDGTLRYKRQRKKYVDTASIDPRNRQIELSSSLEFVDITVREKIATPQQFLGQLYHFPLYITRAIILLAIVLILFYSIIISLVKIIEL